MRLPSTVGIIANPASGRDIRRLTAGASVSSTQEKRAILHRAVAGAIAGGAQSFIYMDDSHGIAASVAAQWGAEADFRPLESPHTMNVLETSRAVSQMREAACGVVLSMGGDGTNRAIVSAWRDVPLIPISVGTNNVFPRRVEGSAAGAAAGLIVSGRVELESVSRPAKVIDCMIEGGSGELALIDAVLTSDEFVGARAIWDASTLRHALVTRADPSAVGISAVAGTLQVVSEDAECGLAVDFAQDDYDDRVLAPIAPGLYREVRIAGVRIVQLDEAIEWHGPGVLAVDGEREHTVRDGETVTLTLRRDGPRVIDIDRIMSIAACRGLFRTRGAATNGN